MDDQDRTDEIIIAVPTRPDAKHPSLLRPARALTAGRRPSDRYLAITLVILLSLFMVFTIYVSIELELIRQTIQR